MKNSTLLVEAFLAHLFVGCDAEKREYRIRLIMRVSLIYSILIVATGLLINAHASFGQILEQRVKVGANNEPLEIFLDRLRAQTPTLSWSYNMMQEPKITLPEVERSLKETLELGLANTGYTYSVKGDQGIVILKQRVGYHESQVITSVAVTVNGTITDAADKRPLPGVNIIVKGTTRGINSDNAGNYALVAEPTETLIFTFIGYKSVEEQVNSRTKIDVELEQDLAILKEVVVNGGYYETTDKLKTGSIVKVTSKDIERQPVTNPLMALQGRVPGVEITPAGGAPGVAPTIRIRGTNSLRNNEDETNGNYPLYVIDGVPVVSAPINSFTSSFTGKGFDPISTLNPANIASIEILKDGDATAIYGSRGANGVVLITTKNAKSKGKTNVEISTYSGVGHVSRQIKLLNTQQYMAMRREAISNDKISVGPYDYDLLYWDTTRNTNWQKLLLGGSANITDAQANISAGTSNTSFRFGGGYHKETLVFPGDFGYGRASGNATINHRSDNDRFNASLSINYGLDNANYFEDGGGTLTSSALTLPAFAPRLYNDDGSINWEQRLVAGVYRATWRNPMAYLLNKQKVVTKNLVSNATLRYELLPGVSLSSNLGYTDLASDEVVIQPKTAHQPQEGVTSGTSIFNSSKRTSWIIEPKLNFDKKIRGHQFTVVAGSTFQSSSAIYKNIGGSQYSSDALLGSLVGAGVLLPIRDERTEYKYMSFYSRVGYNFGEKYIVNITGRRDGSSRFGPGNRFGNFGAVGIGWVFSEEPFLKNISRYLTFGKLRTSFGVTGSDQIGDYSYYSLYQINQLSYQGTKGLIPSSLLNSDYQWEATKKLEAAIETGLFENRIGFEVNWYRNRSSNQLVNYPLSTVTGFPTVLTNFNATIENSGWELLIRGDLINSDSWSWRTSINVSFPKNKLVRFDGIEDSPYATVYKVGEPLSVRSVYHFIGVDKETGLYELEDKNTDGVINALDKSPVNLQPSWRCFGGISNTVQYRGVELSFLIQFSRQTISKYMPDLPGKPGINQPVSVLNRWQSSSDQTDVQRFATVSGPGNNYAIFVHYVDSDHNITNASFLRLKTLSLAYRLPSTLIQRAHLSDTRLYVQGQNLLTLTSYDGLDPETGNVLPPLRMVTIGLQFSL